MQTTIPEQGSYLSSPDRPNTSTSAWHYNNSGQEYPEQQYSPYSQEVGPSMAYNNTAQQLGVSPVNGMADPYFTNYPGPSAQYYRNEYETTFNGGGSQNAGDYTMPSDDSWQTLMAQYKPL